jgi:biopolymer transport protein ExbD
MDRKNEEGSGVNLGIIITPMLDMSFQILAFFIMTYHPSALEGHFDVKLLPPKSASQGPASSNLTPLEKDIPELNDVITVFIKAVGKGKAEGSRLEGDPSQLLTSQVADAAPVTLADTDLPFDEGLKRLSTKLLADSANSKANIKIAPDPELKHQYTMAVYDVCKLAGFQNISFMGPSVQMKKE